MPSIDNRLGKNFIDKTSFSLDTVKKALCFINNSAAGPNNITGIFTKVYANVCLFL